MQSVQRQFGKLWNRAPGDNAKVSILLKDYEDADQVLAKIIECTRSWRDSWVLLLGSQSAMVTEYEALYDPIVGATDGHGREMTPTPELQLKRTFGLREAYGDLKTELVEEIATIDERIVKPAEDARDCIGPVRKTIKKRENKRVDYEKCQDKVNKLQRKPGKSAKEESALAKTEQELSQLVEEFNIADAHLRETLPPIIQAAFSLIPPLLAAQILIQNRLLGLYYTTLHAYCEENGFPSPPPPMEDVMAAWRADFKPVQRDVESIGCIARGKAAHQPMSSMGAEPQARKASASSTRELVPRKVSAGLIPSNGAPQRPARIPSAASITVTEEDDRPTPNSNFRRPDYLAPTDFTTATILGQPSPGASPNSLRPQQDYFTPRERPSTASTIGSSISQTPSLASGGAANGAAAAKKKPPPPPPPKRIPSTKPPEEFVVAQYAFVAQGQGDLSFREGDRIRIVKKTGTDQDWWVGEIGGVTGNFPANYCKAVPAGRG